MHDKNGIVWLESQNKALVAKYDNTLRLVAGGYYPKGGYQYKALLCDLTTHLWEVYPNRPADMDDEAESAWVYVVLSHKALNLVRNEQRHNSLITYSDTLPDVKDEAGQSPLVDRLYELIALLNKDERNILKKYLNYISLAEIGKSIGRSEAYVFRQLNKIREKLRKLNAKYNDI